MKAMILAGGQGLRLRPLTDDKPKPLIRVGRKAIAEIQMDWLKRNTSVEKVVFLCGYKWEKLKEHFGESYGGIKVEYSVEKVPLGTGGAIKQALAKMGETDEDLVVMNGDTLTDLPLKMMIESHSSASARSTVTMLIVPYKSRFGVIYIDEFKIVTKFEEKPVFPDLWINGGIYIVNARKLLKHLPDRGDVEQETFPKLVPSREIVAYPYSGFWTFIDSVKDLREAEDQLKVRAGAF
jgi:NDP-sugar pyrophosphorylase family protein